MKRFDGYFATFVVGLLICILIIVEGCASIGNPSGGPRDERPPRFVGANPAPGSVDIPLDKERFVLNFDELVDVKDPTTKVIVSPPSAGIPRVTAQGRRVIITFRDSLLPNTTYTVDFADAIQDINEGNPIKNFAYSFSTGPDVDSLRIAGRVISAKEMEPMQLKLVGLHRVNDEDDLTALPDPENFNQSIHKNLFTKKFDYVGRTDDRGRFSIEGLAPGRYRVYALDDTNSDYIFSNADEEVAFADVIVSPSSTEAIATDSIYNLKTGTLDTILQRRRTVFLPNDMVLRSALSRRAQQYIEKYERIDSTRINLLFHVPNLEMPELHIVGVPDGPDRYVLERSAGNDTISLWLKSPSLVSTDTLRLSVGYQRLDSVQNYILKTDTLRLTTDRTAINKARRQAQQELERQAKQLAKEAKRNKSGSDGKAADSKNDSVAIKNPTLRVDFTQSSNMDIHRPLIFQTSVPVVSIDTTGFRLEQKVDTVWKEIAMPPIRRDSLNPRLFRIGDSWKPATQYRLSVDSLAIKGMYGLDNGKIEHEFTSKEEKQYCSLKLHISDWPSGRPAFVELLDGSDKPVAAEPLKNGYVYFPLINPGKYYLRIVDDLNADGKWQSGDPLINLQPEATYYYPKAINIKQNWNKEETWNVFSTPVDLMKPEAILKNKPKQPKNRPNNKNTSATDDEEDE